MNKIITNQGVIHQWEIDHLGHLNVQFYMKIYDQATWVFYSKLGFSNKNILQNNNAFVALEQLIKYYKEIHVGDTYEVQTSLIEYKPKIIKFHHELFNAETSELVSDMKITAVFIDTIKRKSAIIPNQFIKKLKSLI